MASAIFPPEVRVVIHWTVSVKSGEEAISAG